MRNTYFTSPATGVEYFIDSLGLAAPVADEGADHGCECELDWNCPLHQGGYTALERQNDAWASQQTELDRMGGWA